MWRLGSYISRGVYTVSGPFHPFGGAVDIIVVEQPDGSFKSSPWYVRFGKFQGVLKTREKVVNISVNDVEANFHMYLDHKGEAYFLREIDAAEGETVFYQSSSSDETDGQPDNARRPMKSKSCNYDADKFGSEDQTGLRGGKTVARASSRRSRILGLVFGRRSMKDDNNVEVKGRAGIPRLSSLESAEIAADLLEVKWSTNLASDMYTKDSISKFSACDALKSKNASDPQINDQTMSNSSMHSNVQSGSDCSNEPIANSSSPRFEQLEHSDEDANKWSSSAHAVENIVESSLFDNNISEQKFKGMSEPSGVVYENRNEEGRVGNLDLQIQRRLKIFPGNQIDGEQGDSERSINMQECSNSTEESVSARVQSLVYCETSQSSVVTLDGCREEAHETLCISGEEINKLQVVAETLLATAEKTSEVMAVKQPEELGLEINEALTIRELHPQLLSVDPVISSVEERDLHSVCAASNICDPGSQAQGKENTKDNLHPPFGSFGDTQAFCGDVDLRDRGESSESSEDEQFLFSDLHEYKLNKHDSVNKGHHVSISANKKDIIGLKSRANELYLHADKIVQENSADFGSSGEKTRARSGPISILRGPCLDRQKDVWQTESLPNMWSAIEKVDAHYHHPLSHSLDSNADSVKPKSLNLDHSSCKKSDANKECHLEQYRSNSPDSEASEDLTNVLSNPAVEISLCKHLLYEGMGAAAAARAFEAERVDRDKFVSLGQSIVKNDRLVIRLGGHYFPWDVAVPILLGMVAYGSKEIFEPKGAILIDHAENSLGGGASKAIVTRSGSWMLWPFSFKRSSSRKAIQPDKAMTVHFNGESANHCIPVSDDDKKAYKFKQVKKITRAVTPTSEQLASLNLKEGRNIVTFTFSTAMLGKQQVDARIFLWKWNDRIVISDVDGTITKSDVLGQFMPLVGRDWSQTGVAHLFSSIKENGYQLLFLSARAIAQAYHTRQFLVNLKQDGKALPDGPVVISPDGLFPSLFREVIRRAPHEFKIACLEDIKSLFPSHCNPFYAGFGNRDTDEISYLKVGIPRGKIFIINPKGEVAVNRRIDTKSYTSLHALVNGMFPPMAVSEQEDFNSWNFWKLPPLEI